MCEALAALGQRLGGQTGPYQGACHCVLRGGMKVDLQRQQPDGWLADCQRRVQEDGREAVAASRQTGQGLVGEQALPFHLLDSTVVAKGREQRERSKASDCAHRRPHLQSVADVADGQVLHCGKGECGRPLWRHRLQAVCRRELNRALCRA